ncbi:MAG: leucyl aminopeptidase [Deltaproteobacteria bacterium CG11_big_fil_rev_8_21_14_0_20_49_13]|nr:MAG: leucyl aminopeptidase [Deltaproteobacteria bacterium CG11_big_fil_rev_8_21_14_0_20_49_13]
MQFKFSKEPLEKIRSDLVLVLCQQKKKDKKDKGTAVLLRGGDGAELDQYLGGIIGKVIKDEEFRGELGTCKIIYTAGKIPARAVILMGMGEMNEFTSNVPRKLGAKVVSVANEVRAKSLAVTVIMDNIKGVPPALRIQSFVEGVLLGSYKFEEYKNKEDIEPDTLKEISLGVKSGGKKIEEAVKKGAVLANGVILARDLINTPAHDLTPEDLAKKAKEIATKGKLGISVLGKKEIEKERLNLLLAVAAGSKNEPRFIHLSYRPAKKARAKIALVGKGVTFDAGGYNLKPSSGMDHMKNDMGGGAVVLGLMKVISELKLPIGVDAYIPATDNMVSGSAEVPGNIIMSRSGKTVEILNTDAEGRLILADAITYATEKKPDIIIDMATLTGHVRYAIGEIYTAVLGNDQKLIDKYIACAKEESEPAWQLPLEKEYKKGLKESLADINNTGKSKAGAIIGALFLDEFVGDTKWIHLDIAESAWTDEDKDYTPKGGTGSPLRSVLRFLSSF